MPPAPKPDFTAWFVMQGLIATMHHPDFHDEANRETLALYQPLAASASKTRLVSRLIHRLPYRWQYAIGGLVTNPGRLRHFYFRKKEIEKQARQLLDAGDIRQLVVLGAGLDLLCLRLARRYPGVHFIEIDTAESQHFKVATLAAYDDAVPGNLEFIQGDLRHPLAGILAASRSHSPAAKTLWIGEGFFMFIPEDSVAKLFSEIRQLSAPGSPVIFTSIPTLRQGTRWGRRIQNFYMKKEKSPFKWAIPTGTMPLFINKLGCKIILQTPCETLHKSYMGQKFDGIHSFAEDMHIAITANM